MSLFRRMLLIAALLNGGAPLVIDFSDGVVTLNDEGNGRKITINGSEVILGE
ncbi:MAG: hypothetical protein ACI4QN_00275 [Candidatus Coproplasma sp.]